MNLEALINVQTSVLTSLAARVLGTDSIESCFNTRFESPFTHVPKNMITSFFIDVSVCMMIESITMVDDFLVIKCPYSMLQSAKIKTVAFCFLLFRIS